MTTELTEINNEVTTALSDKEVVATLVKTTFKGLTEPVMKQAIIEGMMRGFEFKDFLEKNVYAIPFSGGYSLVTSIDYARKIGMRSGVIGKSAPIFEESDLKGGIISCTVTIKRNVNGTVGEFTETVYFNEYSTGKNLWASKPRTMIAKVAEMHALRMACPEEMSQLYAEEELQKEIKQPVEIKIDDYKKKLAGAKTLAELKTVWANMPIEAKRELESLKYDLKAVFESEPAYTNENA